MGGGEGVCLFAADAADKKAAATLVPKMSSCWFSVYLLYWHKSTNTDIDRADSIVKTLALSARGESLVGLLVLLVQKYKY